MFVGDQVRKAAGAGDVDELRRLLKVKPKAVYGSKLVRGRTPLTEAIYKNQLSCVDVLLENNAEVNEYDRDGWLPVSYAAVSGNVRTMEMLVERGADIEKRLQHRDRRALHLAIQSSDVAMVQFLISQGADVNALAELERTPLHFAAESGSVEIAKLLFDAGNWNADAQSTFRVTPQDIAKNNSEMRQFFALNCEKKEPSGKGEIVTIGPWLLDRTIQKEEVMANARNARHWSVLLGIVKVADFLLASLLEAEF